MSMKVRHFVFFVALILLGLLFLRNAGQLEQFISLIKELNIWVLLLVLPVRFGYYWASTRFYDHFFGGIYIYLKCVSTAITSLLISLYCAMPNNKPYKTLKL